MSKKKYPQWYKTVNLKHVTGFLTAAEKQKMKKLAEAADKSLTRYVTRLMQKHIQEMEEAEIRRRMDAERRGEKPGKDGDGLMKHDGRH